MDEGNGFRPVNCKGRPLRRLRAQRAGGLLRWWKASVLLQASLFLCSPHPTRMGLCVVLILWIWAVQGAGWAARTLHICVS